MRPLTRTLAVVALAGVSALAPSAAGASSGNNTISNLKGPLVNAAFSWTDPSGCIQTDVFVNANGQIAQVSPEPGSQGYAAVSISQQNICTGTALLSDFGEKTTLQAGELVISNQLDQATLATTIAVADSVSGASFPMTVDLTWTGTSDIYRDHSFSNDLLGGRCRVINHWKGTGRDANASGSVSDGATNFTPPGSLQWAEIGNVITGSAVIQCG